MEESRGALQESRDALLLPGASQRKAAGERLRLPWLLPVVGRNGATTHKGCGN